ncbi:MAG: diguanylate cyclase domain-containing protein [Spirochaetia bacterium]
MEQRYILSFFIYPVSGSDSIYLYGLDVTSQKYYQEQLKCQAYHDALTGLPNRQLFKDRLNMVIASGSRRDINAALLLFMKLRIQWNSPGN